MDILKRSLAPIPMEGWTAIDDRARQTLSAALTARKFVDLEGPLGQDFAAVPLGRLEYPNEQPVPGVRFGLHKVLPLAEVRVPFELDVTEIDNVTRGAKDIDLSGLDEATLRLAEFEECAVYYGLPQASIVGLHEMAGHPPLAVCCEPEMIVERVTMAVTAFQKAAVQGPYSMIVSPEIWSTLSGQVRGFPLNAYLENMLGGPILVNPFVKDAFLVTTRGGDMKLTIGQDIAIGYSSHTADKVSLFLTESFTFRILDPMAVMRLEWGKQ